MRKLLLVVLQLVLVTGCALRPPSAAVPPSVEASPSEPPLTSVPAVEAEPVPADPVSAGVVRRGDGWAVDGLKLAPSYYMWSPDAAWVAFNTFRGLWAVSGDGRTEHLLAAGDASRELAGWWQGALVFLEHRKGGTTVAVARPGEPVQELATVRGPLRPENLFVGMTALYGRYLALFPRGEAALRVDLASSSVEKLPNVVVPERCGYVVPSPGGRYMMASGMCEPVPARLIDLETWMVHEVDLTVTGGTWSPVDERWAGLTDGHLTVGDILGQYRQIPLPHPMKLRQQMVWSADGRQLALMEETGPSPNGNPRYAPSAIWTVSLDTGEWRHLAVVASTGLRGWHPSGRYLVIVEMIGAATAHFGLLPADGGKMEWLPQLPMDKGYATQVDERLLVVSGWGAGYGTTLYREVAGNVIPLQAGQLPRMDYLQVRPPYRSWVDLSGSSALEVQPLR